jgi:hypothetical protein
MRLGSGEHYGWEQPRTVVVVDVYDGPERAGEFAWLKVPEGAKGGPLDVMVRPRVGAAAWREPAPGGRIDVAAWVLDADDVDELRAGGGGRWAAPKPAPDLWLWVAG